MEMTYELARRMADAIPRFRDAVAAFFDDHLGKLCPDAPAAREIASYPDPQIIRAAYSQGGMLVDVAADHLMGLSKTLTNPVEVFTPWVCGRALLEASALASWFLEPGITADERARRSFAFQFDGLKQQMTFRRACKSEGIDVKALEMQVDALDDAALRLGIEKILDKNGKRSGLGVRLPGHTELIKSVFKDEASYRLQSAMAHGQHWALLTFGYMRPENDDGKSELVTVKKQISASAVGHLCSRAVRAIARPVWYRSLQNGCDSPRLRQIMESAYNEHLLDDRELFWRS
jgi:hypothetical protein